MWLAVDAGNARIKWVTIRNSRPSAVRASGKASFAALKKDAAKADAVWVSHVGTPAEKAAFIKALSPVCAPRFVKSRRAAAGVINHYRPPSALGTDRWLCLLGARARKKSLLIVSAGTAITIDRLSASGEFHGGVILPGLRLLHSTLSEASALPRARGEDDCGACLASSTRQALATGARMAAVGAIEHFIRAHGKGLPLLLTGGDAPHLLPYFPGAQVVPDLIFRGMMALQKND